MCFITILNVIFVLYIVLLLLSPSFFIWNDGVFNFISIFCFFLLFSVFYLWGMPLHSVLIICLHTHTHISMHDRCSDFLLELISWLSWGLTFCMFCEFLFENCLLLNHVFNSVMFAHSSFLSLISSHFPSFSSVCTLLCNFHTLHKI